MILTLTDTAEDTIRPTPTLYMLYCTLHTDADGDTDWAEEKTMPTPVDPIDLKITG